jgi:hypothetical protein
MNTIGGDSFLARRYVMQNPYGIPFDGIHSYYIMLTHFRFCTTTKVLSFVGSVEKPIIVIFNDVLSLIKTSKMPTTKSWEYQGVSTIFLTQVKIRHSSYNASICFKFCESSFLH